LITLTVFIGIWILLASVSTPYTLPGPDRVWSAFVVAWRQNVIQPAFVTTLSEALLGWAIGSAVGLPLAYLLGRWTLFEYAVSPYVAASQAIPIFVIAPLLLNWVGFGMEPKIAFAALLSVFPVTTTTVSGLRAIDKDLRDVARVFGANWRQRLTFVEAPLAARPILSGERIGMTLAVAGALVGEFVNPDQGLGALVLNYRESFDASSAFVAAIAAMFMGGTLYALVSTLERMILRWTE
jgi:NitT/TauT family transport system permease protein